MLVLALLTGCASAYHSVDIGQINEIPDDCKNRKLITDWLGEQLKNPKTLSQKEQEYEAQVSAIKNKMWHVRYVCSRA